MAGSPEMGSVLGSRLALFRERAGLSQQRLSDEIGDQLGFDISRAAIAAIEAAGRPDASARDRSRADRASFVDVLAFAFVLGVPPPLLIVPLGDFNEVRFGNLTTHPHLMLQWIAGEEPPSRLLDDEPASRSIGRPRWYDNSELIRQFDELSSAFRRAAKADAAKRDLEQRGANQEVLAELQRALDDALRALDRHHGRMKAAGLAVPDISDAFADRIMYLRVIDGSSQ